MRQKIPLEFSSKTNVWWLWVRPFWFQGNPNQIKIYYFGFWWSLTLMQYHICRHIDLKYEIHYLVCRFPRQNKTELGPHLLFFSHIWQDHQGWENQFWGQVVSCGGHYGASDWLLSNQCCWDCLSFGQICHQGSCKKQ